MSASDPIVVISDASPIAYKQSYSRKSVVPTERRIRELYLPFRLLPVGQPGKSTDRLSVRREGEQVIVETAARSFLHHRVRSMVGCLAPVGDGRWPEARIAEALAARD